MEAIFIILLGFGIYFLTLLLFFICKRQCLDAQRENVQDITPQQLRRNQHHEQCQRNQHYQQLRRNQHSSHQQQQLHPPHAPVFTTDYSGAHSLRRNQHHTQQQHQQQQLPQHAPVFTVGYSEVNSDDLPPSYEAATANDYVPRS